MQFPINTLKIDRSFIVPIGKRTDRNGAETNAVKDIPKQAQPLGLTLIADWSPFFVIRGVFLVPMPADGNSPLFPL